MFVGYHHVRREFKKINNFQDPPDADVPPAPSLPPGLESDFADPPLLDAPLSIELSNLNIRRNWSLFAEAFTAEAREFSISYRRFPLPAFIAMLCGEVERGTSCIESPQRSD